MVLDDRKISIEMKMSRLHYRCLREKDRIALNTIMFIAGDVQREKKIFKLKIIPLEMY